MRSAWRCSSWNGDGVNPRYPPFSWIHRKLPVGGAVSAISWAKSRARTWLHLQCRKAKEVPSGSGTGLFRGPPLLRRLLRGFLISLAELLCLPHRTPLHLRPPPPFIILSISAIIVSHQWFPSNFSVAYFEDGEARSSLIPLCGGTTIEGRQR